MSDPLLAEVLPYLYRPLHDDELRLGASVLDTLMRCEGLTDDKGELALAAAIALYLDHRAACRDDQAWQRFAHNVHQIRASGQLQLATGAQFVERATDIVGRMKRNGLL